MRCVSLIALLFAGAACAQNGASITVGDEVVFSGGPSQPPQSKQTGMVFEVNNIRGGGGSDAAAGKGRKKGKGDGSTVTVGNGAPGSGNMPADLVPPTHPGDTEVAAAKPDPAPVPDLSKLTTDELAATLGDRDAGRRQAAVTALASHNAPGERAAVKSALESALTDSEPAVVRQAAEARGALGDASAAPAVMKLVYDRDDGVAVSAIKAVATLGFKTALPELTKLGGRDLGPVGRAAREAAAELARPPRSLPIPRTP